VLVSTKSVHGIGHRFSVFAGNFTDHSILGESICDEKDKFFVTVRWNHWAEKVSVNPEVWTFQNWERCQRCPFVCWFFSLLTSKAVAYMSINILLHFWPEVRCGDFQVRFICCIVSSKSLVVSLMGGSKPSSGSWNLLVWPTLLYFCPGMLSLPDSCNRFCLVLAGLVAIRFWS
jgi:hypothetical protein